MITWETLETNYSSNTYEEYENLCINSKPSDFYFYVGPIAPGEDDEDYSFIHIVPKIFFDTYNHMWDQSMNLNHILPEDFGEEMECIWSCERSKEEVITDLIERGFEKNYKFTEFMKADEYY